MSKLLERIRKSIKEHNDSIYYGDMKDTARMVENYYFHNYLTGNADIVETDTEDRGDDWTLWEITIYKVEVEGETAYFKVQKEVGRTKNHDDGGIVVEEVFPQEVKTTRYVSKKEYGNKEKEQTDLVKAINKYFNRNVESVEQFKQEFKESYIPNTQVNVLLNFLSYLEKQNIENIQVDFFPEKIDD